MLANIGIGTHTFAEHVTRTNQLIMALDQANTLVWLVNANTTAAFGRGNTVFDKANAANLLAYNVSVSANAYSGMLAVSGNTYAGYVANSSNGFASYVGDSANAKTISVATSGNSYALTTATSIGTAGNNHTNYVGTSGNSYTNYVGTSGNSYAVTVTAYANNYASAVGTAGNNYTNYVGTSGNSYAVTVTAYANNYASAVGTAGNNYSNYVGASANNWANTKLANASGTITGNVTIAGYANTTTSFYDSKGDVRDIPINSKSTAYVLTAADAGKLVVTTGDVYVPNAVFTGGQAVSVFNNTSSIIRIIANSSVAFALAGFSNNANKVLAQNGLATIVCTAANTFVLSGAGLS